MTKIIADRIRRIKIRARRRLKTPDRVVGMIERGIN